MNRLPKDYRQLAQTAVAHGWRFVRKRRHAWLLSPDGKTTVSLPSSPSDWRAFRNKACELRRAGVQC